MKRAWLVLMVACGIGSAQAETLNSGHRTELQVGAALRMMMNDTDSSPKGNSHDHRYPDVEPAAAGAFSSLSRSLNTDVQLPVESAADEATEPGMAYAVTASLSLGVGYHFVEAEDLVGDLAVAGLLGSDHQSHHVVLRAKWRFQ
jgi:hypothetical protein